MQLVRPPSLPPFNGAPPHRVPRRGDDGLLPKVRIKHPGYNAPTDILITLNAVDLLPGDAVASGELSFGLHHGTVLTICAIIANNAFDVYLTYDREGTRHVDQHGQPDSILPAGTYWAQVPQPTSTPTEAGQQDSPEPTSAAQEPDADAVATPYPIVPDFQNWRFPHGQVPPPWLKDHEPPSLQDPSPETSDWRQASETVQALQSGMDSCAISAYCCGLQKTHIVHPSAVDWFNRNDMRKYAANQETSQNDHPFNDASNLIDLRADLRKVFDSHCLNIVPKPVSIKPSRSASASTSNSSSGTAESSQAARYALTIHVMGVGPSIQLIPLYHNQALCFRKNGNESTRKYQHSREFLFARFAWSIFPLVRGFLGGRRRLLAIRVDGQQANTSAAAPNPHGYDYRWSVLSSGELYTDSDTHTEDSPPRRKRRRTSSASVVQPEQASERLLDWMDQLGEAEAESSSASSQSPGQTDVVETDEEPGGVGV